MSSKSERNKHHQNLETGKDGTNLENTKKIESDNHHSGEQLGKKDLNDVSSNRKKKNLTNKERSEIANFLLLHYNNNRLEKFAISKAADQFSVHRTTIHRIWVRAKETLTKGSTAIDVSSRKKGTTGRKPKDWTAAIERIESIPMSDRSSLHALSTVAQIPKTTLYRLIKNKTIKRRRKKGKSLEKSHFEINVVDEKESNHENDQTIVNVPSRSMKQVIESLKDLDSDQIFEVDKFISHLKGSEKTTTNTVHRDPQDNNNISLIGRKLRIYKY